MCFQLLLFEIKIRRVFLLAQTQKRRLLLNMSIIFSEFDSILSSLKPSEYREFYKLYNYDPANPKKFKSN